MKKEISKIRKAWNKKYTDPEIERIADEMLEWFKEDKNVWLSDFAIQKLISRQRFSCFAKKNEYFNYVYDICKAMQESKLVKIGMSKRANATMAIFALKNVAGWRDTIEQKNINANFNFNDMDDKELEKYLKKYGHSEN